jgi:putative transposase
MGILERLNRTFKYQFIFRHELSDFAHLQSLCQQFKSWYNEQRKHSALRYATPWEALKVQALSSR